MLKRYDLHPVRQQSRYQNMSILEPDIVHASYEPRASPQQDFKRSDEYELFGGQKAINNGSVRDRHPNAYIQAITGDIGSSLVLLKISPVPAYHQIRITEGYLLETDCRNTLRPLWAFGNAVWLTQYRPSHTPDAQEIRIYFRIY